MPCYLLYCFFGEVERSYIQQIMLRFSHHQYNCQHNKYSMEINKPQTGLFRGIGSLEVNFHINRKPFPKIRNIHQFSYQHGHPTNYQTTFNRFHQKTFSKNDYSLNKVIKNANQTQVVLGTDERNKKPYLSLKQADFTKYENAFPPKLIKHNEEGIGFGQNHFVAYQTKHPNQKGKKILRKMAASTQNVRDNNGLKDNSYLKKGDDVYKTQFVSTKMQHFVDPYKTKVYSPKFAFSRRQRFNPITGQSANTITSYGFDDFNQNKKQTYQANNFTRIERANHQREDIITGRIINY